MADHSAYSNPGTQVGAHNKDFGSSALWRRDCSFSSFLVFFIIIIPFYWVLNAEEVIDCSQFPIFAWDRRDRALCVKGSNLGWVSKSLRGRGVVWEEAKEIFFSPPSPYRFKPQCQPPGYIWNQDGRPYRYALDPGDLTKKFWTVNSLRK